MKKGKSAEQRLEEMRRPPSLANWVRLNNRRRDETALRIARFVLAKPRHALAQVYRFLSDYVTLGISAATVRASIDNLTDPLVQRLGHEIADALIPHFDRNDIAGVGAFDGMSERYPIGRNVFVPVRPTFVFLKGGRLTPVFIVGWASASLSGFQKRLMATMIQRAILTQEDFDGSDALVLFTPRHPYSKTTREVKEMWVSQSWLLSDEELNKQFNCYGDALEEALKMVKKALD